MDLNTFAEEDFDPKTWINKAWCSNGNQEKEVFVANTVTRLQLYMKQLSNSLDEINTQLLASYPRVLLDASSIEAECAQTAQWLATLTTMVEDVGRQTGDSIASLQRVDDNKSRLEEALAKLLEADKWTGMATSLEEILDAGVPTTDKELAELAQLVGDLSGSLETQANAPDYDTKRLQLETLFNRLEAAITPALVDTLTAMDEARASLYVTLLSRMRRADAGSRAWRRAAGSRLGARWRRGAGHSLPELHGLIQGDLGKQMDWLTNVLKCETPKAELVKLYTDLLLSLEPSPTKVASASIKLCRTPDEGISMLIDLRRDIDLLVDCIKGVVETQSKETVLPATMKEFNRAVYAPLRELLPKYTELQTQALLSHLNITQQDDLLEQSRTILAIAERSESLLKSAENKAKKIAEDAFYPIYAPCVEAFLSSLNGYISSHARGIAGAGAARAGALGEAFPATLALRQAVLAVLKWGGVEETAVAPSHPLYSPAPAIPSPLPSLSSLQRNNQFLRDLARQLLTRPVDLQLDKIPQLPVWGNNDALSTDLPDFALSPQEYITEIGQYLMTLPQHLEMHLSEKQETWDFLSQVCTHTCDKYAEKILNIRNMDELGTKRCVTDIVYLSSVVEDLGTTITQSLKNLEKTLRAATPGVNEA